ncbi:hypothetical protein Shyhy02_76570 [Streptomyces hygroscopicus subsp. hygroscopicus]|nr:hypothetical protein Shyhy02_76570 [Streptomyces hygroscopicus subsp. hygroscopicus]
MLDADPAGLLGEVGGDRVEGGRHGGGGHAQLGEFGDMGGHVLLAATGVTRVEHLDDLHMLEGAIGELEGERGLGGR